ncbi:hypothetical protein [Cohaesibacter haloalkalitolerans]|uniref:hypothetical protein n=1 Tax=Cohaesibacter haloalkalitolerans TaxID=1162980 RepID=UPI000E65B280|nr:hypothetical protein [Cohaesibacter haloalkalitolerans]
MIFVLLGTFIAGIGAAGAVMVLYKFILHRPRPKGAVPVAAGIAMILLQIVLDYGWYSRATADFGDDVVVLQTREGTSLLQPLSFLFPRTDRFLALDKTSIKTNDALPGIKLATLFQAEKDGPTSTILQLIDCTGSRRADWSGTLPPTQEELQGKAKWFDLDKQDPLLIAACEE